MYQKEIQRRAHSFYMRKQVKVAGRNLEEIKKSIERLKRRTKDKGSDKSMDLSQKLNYKNSKDIDYEKHKNKIIY